MKKLKSYLIIAMLGTAIMFTSCSKDDEKNDVLSSTTTQNTQTVSETIKSDDWKVSYFWDSDKDETYHFTNYTFDFKDDNSISVSNGENQYNGTWSMIADDSHNKLILNFGSTVPLEELNDDWHITNSTSAKIELEDVSGGDGETDYLTFEKL